MNAIILCPGPSLSHYKAREADLIVAVNRAATRYWCHAWAATDPNLIIGPNPHTGRPTWRDVLELGMPKLLTARETPRIIERDAGVQWHDVAISEPATSPQTGFLRYTMTDALRWVVEQRGATSVDVYGYDGVGNLDWDGVAGGGNRTPYRWESEGQIFAHWCRLLAARGVTIERHGGTADVR